MYDLATFNADIKRYNMGPGFVVLESLYCVEDLCTLGIGDINPLNH